jgi:hypothetical protein
MNCIYDHNHVDRSSYFHKTYSLEVDYSLFIMLTVLMTFERSEIQPAAAPTKFPPTIFGASNTILVFQCFCGRLLSGCVRRPLYMHFRSRP